MKKKNKWLKILISIVIIFILLLSSLAFCYNSYFKPTTNVTSINSEIEINPLELAIKLIPKQASFSLKEIKVNSNINFTDADITNLAILAINQDNIAKNFITGLKVSIENNSIHVFVQFKYLNIPLEAKLIFNCSCQNGQAILTYQSGKVGFVNIPSSIIFNQLTSNEFITVYPNENQLALNFKGASNIHITKFDIVNNQLSIGIEAILKLF
ncbi:MAG: hypothetical protein ACRDD2_13795 [Sarcina sp.]